MEGHEKVTDVLNVVKHVHVRNESKLLVVVVVAAAAVAAVELKPGWADWVEQSRLRC